MEKEGHKKVLHFQVNLHCKLYCQPSIFFPTSQKSKQVFRAHIFKGSLGEKIVVDFQERSM